MEQFWNQTLRDIISQKVGEEQAKRVEGGAFKAWPPTEMFAIYKVTCLSLASSQASEIA